MLYVLFVFKSYLDKKEEGSTLIFAVYIFQLEGSTTIALVIIYLSFKSQKLLKPKPAYLQTLCITSKCTAHARFKPYPQKISNGSAPTEW